MKSRFWSALVLTLVAAPALFPALAGAEDLLQVFRDARSSDAQYASARFTLQAGLEKIPQGRSLILPTLGLTAGTTRTNAETALRTFNPDTLAPDGWVVSPEKEVDGMSGSAEHRAIITPQRSATDHGDLHGGPFLSGSGGRMKEKKAL